MPLPSARRGQPVQAQHVQGHTKAAAVLQLAWWLRTPLRSSCTDLISNHVLPPLDAGCAGFLSSSLALLSMPCASGVVTGVLANTLTMGALGLSRGGFSVNHMDIAPKYAGIVMGISNTAGACMLCALCACGGVGSGGKGARAASGNGWLPAARREVRVAERSQPHSVVTVIQIVLPHRHAGGRGGRGGDGGITRPQWRRRQCARLVRSVCGVRRCVCGCLVRVQPAC